MLTFRRVIQFITFCALIVAVLASPTVRRAASGTNGDRFARGLAPLKPRSLYKSDATRITRNYPSSSPGVCSSGTTPQCCVNFTKAKDSIVVGLLKALGLTISGDEDVGVTCGPLGPICLTQKLCCEDVSHFGTISIGCSKL